MQTAEKIIPDFLSGGGKMGELIRATNWKQTSLGNPDTWPQALRIAVRIMLDSPFGMYIAWSPDYIQLYNDGYRPILGATKHPNALGNSTRKTFAEIWPTIGPMFQGVMDGIPVGYPDFILHLDRNGFLEECVFDFSYSPIRLEDGTVAGVLVTVIETTQKVQAVKALKENEQQLKFAIEAAGLATWDLNPVTNKFTGNDRLKEWFGLPSDAEIELPIALKVIDDNDREMVITAIQNALNPSLGGHYDIVYTIIHPKTKQPRVVQAKGRAFFNAEGVAYRFNGTLQDVSKEITEAAAKKEVEKTLAYRTALLEAQNEAIPDAILIVDTKGKMLSFNQHFVKLWKIPGDIIERKDDTAALSYAMTQLTDPEAFIARVNYCYAHPDEKAKEEVHFKDGRIIERYGNVVTGNDGTVYGWAWYFRDITAQKNAEAEIRRFKHMADNACEPFILIREDGAFAYLNDLALERWGYTQEEATHLTIEDVSPAYTKEVFKEAFAAAQNEKLPTFETIHKRKDGTNFPVEVNMGGLTLEGKPYLFAMARDITQRMATEMDLKSTRDQLQTTFNNIPSGIYLINKNAELIYINDKGAKVYGDFTPTELLAEKDLRILFKKAEEFFERYDEEGRQFGPQHSPAFMSLTTCKPSQNTLRQVNKKTGEERWHYVQGAPLFDEIGDISMVLVTSTDITIQKLAEEEIRQSEERFRNLANSIPQLAWMADAEGWIYWYNRRWYDYTGTTLKDMQGWGWQTVHHPDLIEGVTKRYKKAISLGEPYDETFLLRSHAGEYRWFLTRCLPIHDAKGVIVQWFGTNTDVTTQHNIELALKRSEEYFRSLAETLPQLIWMTDEKGEYEYASSQWQKYSGLDPLDKSTWELLVHPDDMAPLMRAWQKSLLSGQPYHAETRLKSKEGVYRWHVVNGASIYNPVEGKATKWIGAFTDIHEQKIKEQQKDEFLSIASHEMKTPLTSAKAYLQLLELTLDNKDEKIALYAKKASISVNRLNELISELLDVSKIQYGKLNYNIDFFNFDEMINDTVQDIQYSSLKHTILKSGNTKKLLRGDKDRLQQVVINLLSNAIKYSPEAANVYITLTQQNDEVMVAVKDTGIGIPQQHLKKIFERYYRVEEHAVEFQGLGIGLFISCEIIERHKGRLWAESELGKGSTFYFTLPLNNI